MVKLWNCGNNVPQVVGNPLAIVAQQFDVRPNPTTGAITGTVYGSNQILCWKRLFNSQGQELRQIEQVPMSNFVTSVC
jgi:hypothetical protein